MRSPRDVQSLAYLLLLPTLVALEWRGAFASAPVAIASLVYLATLVLAVGVTVVHHNHAHLPIFRSRTANYLVLRAIALLQGTPTFLFVPAHVESHHRHNQGPDDVTRLSRFGGETNDVFRYVAYPVRAAFALSAFKRAKLAELRAADRPAYLTARFDVALLVAVYAVALFVDWRKALLYMVAPQAFALHLLLGTNYLQHAKTKVGSAYDHSRNFVGTAMNLAWFNVGFHTAHHERAGVHWSRLPALHAELAPTIDPSLVEPSLTAYFVRELVFRGTARALRALRR